MKYKRGRVRSFENVDPDCISLVVLMNTLKEEIIGVKVKELWCAFRESRTKGLVKIENDAMAVDMMKETDADGVVTITIVQLGEGSPIKFAVAAKNANLPHKSKLLMDNKEVVVAHPRPHLCPYLSLHISPSLSQLLGTHFILKPH